MIRYVATAGALKAFSATPQTRALYRRLGNTYGARRRVHTGLPDHYHERARDVLAAARRNPELASGSSVLELGTGWLAWESTVLRLVHDVRMTLFDVWDNRQWEPFRAYMGGLAQRLDDLELEPEERRRAADTLQEVLGRSSFDEVYAALGFRYVVEPSGSLSGLAAGSFDAIMSTNVLEHVDRSILPGYTRDMARVLRPGGIARHTIDLDDHLSDYDSTTSRKQYLRYSPRTWRLAFQNSVQYFNRVQRPEWLALFGQAGLDLVDEGMDTADLTGLPVHPSYRRFSPGDLECTTLRVVYRRPEATAEE